MGAVYRLAMRKDASALYDVRRRSILELAPPTMPMAEAEAWATQLTLSGMERKLCELEIWIAERDGVVAGWGAIRGDYVEGLYTAPEYAGQGVGAALLDRLERADACPGRFCGPCGGQFKRQGLLPSARLQRDGAANA